MADFDFSENVEDWAEDENVAETSEEFNDVNLDIEEKVNEIQDPDISSTERAQLEVAIQDVIDKNRAAAREALSSDIEKKFGFSADDRYSGLTEMGKAFEGYSPDNPPPQSAVTAFLDSITPEQKRAVVMESSFIETMYG
jgi:hypothetical protein